MDWKEFTEMWFNEQRYGSMSRDMVQGVEIWFGGMWFHAGYGWIRTMGG